MILIVITGFTEVLRRHLIAVKQVDLLSHCSDALCMRVICIPMKGDHFDVRPYAVSSFFVTNKTSFKLF